MRGKPHRPRHHAPTDAPHQLILRAVVSSLVVCATLGAADARARTVSHYAGAALVRASAVFQPQSHTRHVVHVRAARGAAERAGRSDSFSARSLAHLVASSSGKQFSHAPGMSRERAGNLISQSLALP
jgi:hypothetical protein